MTFRGTTLRAITELASYVIYPVGNQPPFTPPQPGELARPALFLCVDPSHSLNLSNMMAEQFNVVFTWESWHM